MFDTLDGLKRHGGLRWVWLVGDAFSYRNKACLRCDGDEDPLPLREVGELLVAAAEAQAGPVVAVVDVCRAGEVLGGSQVPDNLALFLACEAGELARADVAGGGWTTQRLLAALRGGARTVRQLEDALHAARLAEHRGDQRAVCLIGRHAGQTVLVPGLALVGASSPVPEDMAGAARAAWRDHMTRAERFLRPLFGEKRAIDEVFVEVAVGPEGAGQGMPLAELLAAPGAWVIVGSAGAGKTTLARRHARRLALAGGRLPVYLPLARFVEDPAESLWAYAQGQLAKGALPQPEGICEALPQALSGPHPEGVCLLLDGLDEVAGAPLARLVELLDALPQALPGAVIAVFTRPQSDQALLESDYREARVQGLAAEEQQKLLEAWVPTRAAELWRSIQADARLQELAQNPLLLTLLALVGQGRRAPKTRAELYHAAVDVLLRRKYGEGPGLADPEGARVVLRHLSLALQIRGGEAWPRKTLEAVLAGLAAGRVQWQTVDAGALDPEVARQEAWEVVSAAIRDYNDRVRAQVSAEAQLAETTAALVALKGLADGEWALRTVAEVIEDNQAQGSLLEKALAAAWETPAPAQSLSEAHAEALHGESLTADVADAGWDGSGFLTAVARSGGLWVTPDGAEGDYAFLHRALRDALAAEQLARALPQARGAVLSHATGLRHGQALGRWGETYALLVAQAGARDAPGLLKALGQASPALARRAALGAEACLPAPVVLAALMGCKGWDGEELRRLAEGWRQDPERLAALRAVAVEAQGDPETIARVHYALSAVVALGDEATFFRDAGLPEPAADAFTDWVKVPGGTFQMGSENGHSDERPVHSVTVTAFELGRTPVTVAQFQRLAPEHSGAADDHPVTNVSWYAARLYARWVGLAQGASVEVDLPTEAEWECAARGEWDGGKPGGRWWFGDDEARLAGYAWYEKYSGRQLHPVATREHTAGGLRDLYGNVAEWCADWYGPYASVSPASPLVKPAGSSGGVDRVVRGGDGWSTAGGCRSAFRGRVRPARPSVSVGFRLRLRRRPSTALDH